MITLLFIIGLERTVHGGSKPEGSFPFEGSACGTRKEMRAASLAILNDEVARRLYQSNFHLFGCS